MDASDTNYHSWREGHRKGRTIFISKYPGDGLLEEGLVKLLKCLKNMLDNISSKSDTSKKLQTVGFIYSELQSYAIRADRPTKYITRIQKSRNCQISSDMSQFVATALLALVTKDILKTFTT
ncbi:hypothetical protein INT47_011046 [Mucor saturninus]|uniref:Uncharacterized protein n=1 Tax=Mucor saturninus TaxID=64648 RepID=A0A8H7RFW6_9FUNG|nr:hypothetical protein INT47_011046 [Mucor saturninus]